MVWKWISLKHLKNQIKETSNGSEINYPNYKKEVKREVAQSRKKIYSYMSCLRERLQIILNKW
jgi:hypothetical protein